MTTLLYRFWTDQRGATAIEYGLIAGLIAVVAITGARRLGGALNSKFLAVANAIGPTAAVP